MVVYDGKDEQISFGIKKKGLEGVHTLYHKLFLLPVSYVDVVQLFKAPKPVELGFGVIAKGLREIVVGVLIQLMIGDDYAFGVR